MHGKSHPAFKVTGDFQPPDRDLFFRRLVRRTAFSHLKCYRAADGTDICLRPLGGHSVVGVLAHFQLIESNKLRGPRVLQGVARRSRLGPLA